MDEETAGMTVATEGPTLHEIWFSAVNACPEVEVAACALRFAT
jgi:hypothetical protein